MKQLFRELNIICIELRCATGQNWASSNMVKAEIVNIIVKAFGGDALVQTERKKKKCFNPESLIASCVNYVKRSQFPKEHLQIPITSLFQIENQQKWYSRSTVPMSCYVPAEDNSSKVINFFSYPEYCEERNNLEFRTFDFMHILTNL